MEIFTSSRRWTSRLILSRLLAGSCPVPAHRPSVLSSRVAARNRLAIARPMGPLTTLRCTFGFRAAGSPRRPMRGAFNPFEKK
ncbi:MAG TPA: hypothetical protein VK465_12580 [Fibrobacteria bacterium]|nr:hypothetical protein [Fibrobacteria bacterium]